MDERPSSVRIFLMFGFLNLFWAFLFVNLFYGFDGMVGIGLWELWAS